MPRHPDRPVRSRLTETARATLVGSALLALILTGCTPQDEDDSPSPSTTTTSSTPTPTEEPAPIAFVPGGTADENLPIFTQIVDTVWASADNAAGRAYVDALVAVGFDKAAMQVTEDTSTIGQRAESLQFSVQVGEQCLVGQVGPATGDPVATVLPALPDGGCLIGQTRPIDW